MFHTVSQNSRFTSLLLIPAVFLLAACQQPIPKEALQLSPRSLEDREMQSRRLDAAESEVLSASAQVLQDLGFHLDESETALGVLVGSKTRDATEAGQVAAAVFVALMGGGIMPIDSEQRIRASIVTEPVDGDTTSVRATFQRIVWNNRNEITKVEHLNQPEFYQEFYNTLSKSLFLETEKL